VRALSLMALAAWFTVGSAVGAEKVVIGIGNSRSCATWTQERKVDPDSIALRLMEQWVVGYMTGANAALPDDEDLLQNIDFNSLMARMDEFCQANPKEDLSFAANVVALDLASRVGGH
jgi:hypothetical protein